MLLLFLVSPLKMSKYIYSKRFFFYVYILNVWVVIVMVVLSFYFSILTLSKVFVSPF